MGPVWKPVLPAMLVSEAGLEPAKPASLAQYLCQFGYTDIWSEQKESNLRHVVPGHGYFRYTTPR